ncbi:hypothetical protein LUX34_03275 [Streptomyces werraensis]|nr:hypothetical protein [Streptomyces werraensis]
MPPRIAAAAAQRHRTPGKTRSTADMTVPEENRPKTHDTDETLESRREGDAQAQGGTGRTMREALEEAEIKPDDYEER